MCNSDKFRNNLSFFKENFSDVVSVLPQEGALLSAPVLENGLIINIDLGSGCLYDGNGLTFSEIQVRKYIENPHRIIVKNPSGSATNSDISMRLAKEAVDTLARLGVNELTMLPRIAAGVLIIFGIGIGAHLHDLIKSTNSRAVIIIEPVCEFIYHSMSVIDWHEIKNVCADNHKTLHVLTGGDPGNLSHRLDGLLRKLEMPFLDGSYVYTHYYSWIFEKMKEIFSASIPYHFISRGFYEDEVRMIENSTRNFIRHDHGIVQASPRLRREEPVFLIGSGPSLDQSIEVVRAFRDKVVIFSCGTALPVLLANGIVPDYHCELENGELVYELLKAAKEKWGFDGITLLASATVHPDVPLLFDEKFFFFRDSVSSTKIYSGKYGVVDGTAPTVTNTAFSMAALLGFYEVYLFGVDCGVRDREVHHAADSAYYTNKSFKELADSARLQFDIVLPGNFGGEVRTHWVYDMTRRLLEAAQQYHKLKLVNCSDGALISGARTKHPKMVKLTGPVLDRDAIKLNIRNETPYFTAGEFFKEKSLDEFVLEWDDLIKYIRLAIDEACRDSKDMQDFAVRMQQIFYHVDANYSGLSAVVSGSGVNMPKIGMFFANRVEDEEKRKVLFAELKSQYANLIDEVMLSARDLFVGLSNEVRSRHR